MDESKKYLWILVFVIVVAITIAYKLAYKRRAAKALGGAETSSYILLPAGKGPHTHTVDLDADGSGVSTKAEGHRHSVQNKHDVGIVGPEGKVIPGSHTHSIAEHIVDL